MTFDGLVATVRRKAPHVDEREAQEIAVATLDALGLAVNEASGEIEPRPKPVQEWAAPVDKSLSFTPARPVRRRR